MHVVYEITWNNVVESDRLQMTICRVRIACWIPKATYRHPEYVILIAFPLQQWLHERASMLRYMYIACLVFFSSVLRTETSLKAVFVDVLSITFRREISLRRETVGWLGPVSTLPRLRLLLYKAGDMRLPFCEERCSIELFTCLRSAVIHTRVEESHLHVLFRRALYNTFPS